MPILILLNIMMMEMLTDVTTHINARQKSNCLVIDNSTDNFNKSICARFHFWELRAVKLMCSL
jgi:hypothetical protein